MEGSQCNVEVEVEESIVHIVVAVGVAEVGHKVSVGKERWPGMGGVGVEAADKVGIVEGLGAGNGLSIVAVLEEFGMAHSTAAEVQRAVQRADGNIG